MQLLRLGQDRFVHGMIIRGKISCVADAVIARTRALAVCLMLASGWREAPPAVENAAVPVDVSRDGRTVVFDLGGDLYTLPIAGGRARRITSGPAIDRDPRWSPDGKRIAFASDRGGWENLWTLQPGTGRLVALTHDSLARHVVTPAWSPDGSEIIISFGESAPGFEIIPLDGGTRQRYPAEPVGRFASRGVTGAIFSPDARTLLFQSGSQRLGDTQIYRYDRLARQQRPITSEPGGAMRPVLSPDGRRLAFVTRVDSATTLLKIRDIESATERVVGPTPARDAKEIADSIGFAGYAFAPNGASLVMSAGGKLWRIDVAGGARREIVGLPSPVTRRGGALSK